MRPEEKIEKIFVDKLKKIGIKAYKFEKVKKGAPDRVVLLPNGISLFFEFKVPGGSPDAHQEEFIRHLNSLGFRAEVVDNWIYPYTIVKSYLKITEKI